MYIKIMIQLKNQHHLTNNFLSNDVVSIIKKM